MRKTLFSLLIVLLTSSAWAEDGSDILVNNRILAVVNNKNITTVDVMKQMDVYLRQQHPESYANVQSRYQFYTNSWKKTLSQLIDNQLILADATKLDLKVTEGEIRETIHERFGPHVMTNLDKLGLTYQEAKDMIYAELAVQRMSWYRVHMKAMQRIGPQEIKKGYVDYIAHNPPKETWKYQVVSIRSAASKIAELYAQKAMALIHNEPLSFEMLVNKLKEDLDTQVAIQVSEEYAIEDKDLSSAHKAVLCNLTPNTYSAPIAQTSRLDKAVVHRIFYLKDHTKETAPTFHSMVEKIHDDLMQKEITKEFPKYVTKLRKRFELEDKTQDALPRDFQPFLLK